VSRLRLPWVLVAVGLVAFAATRALHPVRGLGNPDIGGILYSADTINLGLLPYVETVDAKQPGSFFLVAAIFRISRSIEALQIAFAIWLLLGAPAIWIAARSLYLDAKDGARASLAPPLATSLYLILAGAFDLNYAAWMMVPYAWALAMLARGLIGGGGLATHVLAGAFAATAYLFKAQAVVLAPLFVVLFFWAKWRGVKSAGWRAPIGWAAGALVALVPLFVHYGVRGEIPSLIGGLIPLSEANAYSAKRTAAVTDLAALWKVPRQQIRAFFVPLSLGVAALFGLRAARRDPQEPAHPSTVPALLFYAAGVLGCGIGGRRFFVHYLAQCLPAVVLVAAHPAALEWLTKSRKDFSRRTTFVVARIWAALVVGLLAFNLGRIPFRKNAVVDNPGSPVVEQAGSYVREHAAPGDTLLVWGWAGWGSYFYSGLRSPSPVFKVLGQVTEYNDNTAFSKGTSIGLKPGPVADRLLADFRASPPTFIVRSSPFFPGTTGDPLEQWPELKTIVDRDYAVAARYGHLTVYSRRSRSRRH
jgi:hypothetical protein